MPNPNLSPILSSTLKLCWGESWSIVQWSSAFPLSQVGKGTSITKSLKNQEEPGQQGFLRYGFLMPVLLCVTATVSASLYVWRAMNVLL